jgi:hypothetical protein
VEQKIKRIRENGENAQVAENGHGQKNVFFSLCVSSQTAVLRGTFSVFQKKKVPTLHLHLEKKVTSGTKDKENLWNKR